MNKTNNYLHYAQRNQHIFLNKTNLNDQNENYSEKSSAVPSDDLTKSVFCTKQ